MSPRVPGLGGWRRLGALLALLGLALAGAARAESPAVQVEAGRRIYLEGVLPDGTPLRGFRPGAGEVSGRLAACANCHRRSGMGGVEGVSVAPPLAGGLLFSPPPPRREARVRHAAGMRFQDYPHQTRPAYDRALLARALRQGVGAGGETFGLLMPRYVLSDGEVDALSAYLRSLPVGVAPGVTDEAVHFATVVAPDADPAQTRAMLDVLERCIPAQSPRGADSRAWRWQVWRVQGPRALWEAQLDEHYRRQPVLALVAGISGGDWAPVQRFAERARVASLYPAVQVVGEGGEPYFSFYTWPGLALEGRVVAARLLDGEPPRRVRQVFRPGRDGEVAARALAEALAQGATRVEDWPLPAGPLAPRAAERAVEGQQPGEALVLWLEGDDLAALTAQPPPPGVAVFASATLAGLERAPVGNAWRPAIRLVYPFEPEARRLGRMVLNVGGWLADRGLALDRATERVQGAAYSTCEMLGRAMRGMGEQYSPDYLLEWLENSVEGALAMPFPRFTLGPGQRFGSKGAYLMRYVPPGLERLEPDGEWIVP